MRKSRFGLFLSIFLFSNLLFINSAYAASTFGLIPYAHYTGYFIYADDTKYISLDLGAKDSAYHGALYDAYKVRSLRLGEEEIYPVYEEDTADKKEHDPCRIEEISETGDSIGWCEINVDTSTRQLTCNRYNGSNQLIDTLFL